MNQQYYIHSNGAKDGPLDLITIMRRIRSGKITADSNIYINSSTSTIQARDIPEIAAFFEKRQTTAAAPKESKAPPTFVALFKAGWQFTQQHTALTIYAGGIMLISVLLGMLLLNMIGAAGGIIAICAFVVMHNVYLIYALRRYRGQTIGQDFLEKHLEPVLKTLVVSSLVMGLMTAGGLVLLIIPGIFVTMLYIFAPYLIFDKRYSLVEALQGSRLLLNKKNGSFAITTGAVVSFHLLCLLLIVPIPITLPMFAAMLSEIYEELLAS